MNLPITVIDSHKHFVLGENKQHFPDEDFIIHLAEPRCFIRFKSKLAMFADYDSFVEEVTHVEFIDGPPSDGKIKSTLIDAYNFLVIEDRILEGFFDDVEGDFED